MDLLSTLVQNQTLGRGAAKFLQALIQCHQPLLITGEAGSGKTTLLAACLLDFSVMEHVVLVDARSELIPLSQHWTQLVPRPPVTMAQIVKQAVQTRPRWLVVDEASNDTLPSLLDRSSSSLLFTLRAADPTQVLTRITLHSGY